MHQIVANLVSIFNETSREGLQGSKEWRLKRWSKIIDYTFHGQYFWTGKGFGINLANDDGFQVFDRIRSLRSPHNGHLTVLAHIGVPGLALWIFLQVAFGGTLLSAYSRAKRRLAEPWAKINLWIFVYWFAFLVNASFDVFLESPQGGIWFWSLFGLGIAILEAQRRTFQEHMYAPRVATNTRHTDIMGRRSQNDF